MKIPEPRKLPSGNWFIQLRIDGQSISITEADKDTCIAKAMAYKTGVIKAKKTKAVLTVGQAVDKYIDTRQNSLSPSSVRGYKTIRRTRFESLMSKPADSLNAFVLQKAINDEAKLISAKTLKNAWRLIASAINAETGERFNVLLPQVVSKERPYLDPDQIPLFLSAIRGTDVEIPALLGLWSMRRSEIIGLRWKSIDFKNKIIKIESSAVYDENEKLVMKDATKNITSRRSIPMCDRLYELLSIEEHTISGERVVKVYPNTIGRRVNKVCVANNLPPIGAHGLRHSFASLAYYLKIPEKVAMEIGGWSNDATMKKIYTHIAQKEIAKQSQKMLDYFNAIANENAEA